MTRFLTIAKAAAVAAILAGLPAMPRVDLTFAENLPAAPAFRLPDYAAPVRYRLDLSPNPDQDTFTGAVEIDLSFSQASKILWLNADKLEVKHANLTVGGQPVGVKVITTPKDYVGFSFDRSVGPGPATLHATFEGKIDRKDMQGIFQVKDGDNWYVYSQFENIGARRAFPCFDEPGYKVPWQVTLHVREGLVALSNTPIISEVPGTDGMKTVKFAETKPLPSYLVAIGVGNFEFADAGTAGKKKTRIRIVVPHGRVAEARYAVETTPAIVNLLENYFGIPYPYEKLDELVIPLAGYAMEHPGLVTFGSFILAKPQQETLGFKRGYASVAAHELAHQWFGDLVTTAWWDDIWLNEGFASWMANKIVNQFHPEWKMNIGELNGYQGAMETDALVSSRKVRQPIESNDDIANAFDNITYNKGSALLNMFESYLGAEKFQEGVRRYLARYAWRNATSAEFLAELGGGNKTIAAAFSSFLDQAGVPLVAAQLDCDGGAARVELSQQRFLPLGSHGSSDQTWEIPVCVRYESGAGDARDCTLLTAKSAALALTKAHGCPGWIEANAGAAGYYRTDYKGGLLNALLKDDAKPLDLSEKVGLIGDIAALVDGGQIPQGTALSLMPNLVKDPARQVITKTMQITTGIEDHFVPERLQPKYRKYLADLYGERAHQLGWKSRPGEDDDTRLLRPSILGVVATYALDPDLLAQSKKLALAWLADRKAIDSDMVDDVLRSAASNGDRALFDAYRAAAGKEKDERQREELLNAMGSFRDPEIARIAMPIVLTDEFDNRESIDILFGFSQWPQTRDLAYNFVKENFDAMVAKFPTDSGAFFPFIAGGYCDNEHRADVESFFKGRSTKYAGGPRNLDQVLEGISLCAAHKKAQQPSVIEFLEKY